MQSPQASTNRVAIRSHSKNRRFLGTLIRSPLLLAARNRETEYRSLSVPNPPTGQSCFRIHTGFSVFTPHDTHTFVVPFESTATKCVPSRSHSYSSSRSNVPYAAPARFRGLPRRLKQSSTLEATRDGQRLLIGKLPHNVPFGPGQPLRERRYRDIELFSQRGHRRLVSRFIVAGIDCQLQCRTLFRR